MVPAEILRKPGALTDAERVAIQAHTVMGERLLTGQATMARAARIARSHHECWDGTGYPDGLRGEVIPIEARITSCADVLDALVGHRCYKPSWPYEAALERVCSLSGTVLDPSVIDALRACDAEGSLRVVWMPRASTG